MPHEILYFTLVTSAEKSQSFRFFCLSILSLSTSIFAEEMHLRSELDAIQSAISQCFHRFTPENRDWIISGRTNCVFTTKHCVPVCTSRIFIVFKMTGFCCTKLMGWMDTMKQLFPVSRSFCCDRISRTNDGMRDFWHYRMNWPIQWNSGNEFPPKSKWIQWFILYRPSVFDFVSYVRWTRWCECCWWIRNDLSDSSRRWTDHCDRWTNSVHSGESQSRNSRQFWAVLVQLPARILFAIWIGSWRLGNYVARPNIYVKTTKSFSCLNKISETKHGNARANTNTLQKLHGATESKTL